MRLLLDTHTLIWFFTDSTNLSESLKSFIESKENESYVSIASLWEIGIKYSLKKLSLKTNLSEFFVTVESSSVRSLPLTSTHILQLSSLPLHHRDPFDRLIIAQAMVENLTIVTKDKLFSSYDVNLK